MIETPGGKQHPTSSARLSPMFLVPSFQSTGFPILQNGNDQPERTHETYKEGGGPLRPAWLLEDPSFYICGMVFLCCMGHVAF